MDGSDLSHFLLARVLITLNFPSELLLYYIGKKGKREKKQFCNKKNISLNKLWFQEIIMVENKNKNIEKTRRIMS